MIQEPTQPTATPGVRAASRRSVAAKFGLIVAAFILLAIPVVMAMTTAAPLTPTNALAAGASAAPSHGAAGRSDNGNGPGRRKADLGLGRGGAGRGPITIRAISGTQVSLATADGWSRTISVTTDTVITRAGVKIAVGALNVGDQIGFRQTRNADGSYTIKTIEVRVPRAGGRVSAIDGDRITIEARDGTTRVISVTGSTVYKVGSNAGSKADVKVGRTIEAQGTISGTTFTAISVQVKLQAVGGVVTGKTADAITVTTRDGSSKTIHVTASTTYARRGTATASLADVAVGDRVSATGMLRPDGSIDAVKVHASGPKTPKAPAGAPSAVPG
jgi:hypothetical protein